MYLSGLFSEPDCRHEKIVDLGDGWGKCEACGDDSFPMTEETAGQPHPDSARDLEHCAVCGERTDYGVAWPPMHLTPICSDRCAWDFKQRLKASRKARRRVKR